MVFSFNILVVLIDIRYNIQHTTTIYTHNKRLFLNKWQYLNNKKINHNHSMIQEFA